MLGAGGEMVIQIHIASSLTESKIRGKNIYLSHKLSHKHILAKCDGHYGCYKNRIWSSLRG